MLQGLSNYFAVSEMHLDRRHFILRIRKWRHTHSYLVTKMALHTCKRGGVTEKGPLEMYDSYIL